MDGLPSLRPHCAVILMKPTSVFFMGFLREQCALKRLDTILRLNIFFTKIDENSVQCFKFELEGKRY